MPSTPLKLALRVTTAPWVHSLRRLTLPPMTSLASNGPTTEANAVLGTTAPPARPSRSPALQGPCALLSVLLPLIKIALLARTVVEEMPLLQPPRALKVTIVCSVPSLQFLALLVSTTIRRDRMPTQTAKTSKQATTSQLSARPYLTPLLV